MGRVLDILQHPHPLLRTASRRMAEFGVPLRELADDMLATMYAARGMGLAAVQIGIPASVIVVDVSPSQVDPHVMVNPYITKARDTQRVRAGAKDDEVQDLRKAIWYIERRIKQAST